MSGIIPSSPDNWDADFDLPETNVLVVNRKSSEDVNRDLLPSVPELLANGYFSTVLGIYKSTQEPEVKRLVEEYLMKLESEGKDTAAYRRQFNAGQ